MEIDKIREKLAEEISKSEEWLDKLKDTEPVNYGVHYWEVHLSKDDIVVDLLKKSFSFKNAHFSFNIYLMNLSEEDVTPMSFAKMAEGKGHFEFTSNYRGIAMRYVEIEVDLALFGGRSTDN